MKQVKRFLSDIEKETSYGICISEISQTKWVGIGSDTFKLNTVYMCDGFYCLGICRNEHNSIVELNLYYWDYGLINDSIIIQNKLMEITHLPVFNIRLDEDAKC